MVGTQREASAEARLAALDAVVWAANAPAREMLDLARIDRQAAYRYRSGAAPSLRTLARAACAVAIASSERPAKMAADLAADLTKMARRC